MARLKGAGEDTRTSQIVLDTLEKRLCEFIQHREVIVQPLQCSIGANREFAMRGMTSHDATGTLLKLRLTPITL